MVDYDSVSIEYPALYMASDAKSVQAQNIYIRSIALLLILIIMSSLTSLFANYHQFIAILSLVFLAFTPILSLILALKRYDRIWYAGRSLAESIKTMSWRFMMRSQPYEYEEEDDNVTRASFVNDLKQIFHNSKDFCRHLSDTASSADELPDSLERIRKYNLDDRKQIYLVHRIAEQQAWYWKKGGYNNRMAGRWFWSMIMLQVLAITSAAFKIANTEWNYLPTDVFAACVVAVVGWIQVKRFQDLGTSYTLAAREIGMAKMSFGDIKDEKQFSDFVGNTENAFSREHTQWFARRDT